MYVLDVYKVVTLIQSGEEEEGEGENETENDYVISQLSTFPQLPTTTTAAAGNSATASTTAAEGSLPEPL